jgi:GTP cyclohydrolase II
MSHPPPARIRNSIDVPLRLRSGVVAPAQIVSFHGLADDKEHFAIVLGDPLGGYPPLVRVHSECITGDVLGSGRCDCGAQLDEALTRMAAADGVVLYLRQEGRGIGLYNKLDAYGLQDAGFDTYEANRMLELPEDPRTYGVAAQMLTALGLEQIDLFSNNPLKAQQLTDHGIVVRRVCPTGVHLTPNNERYLLAKVNHGHTLVIDSTGAHLHDTSGS